MAPSILPRFLAPRLSSSLWRTLTTAATSTHPVIIVSGPSGTGKSTLLKRLFAAHPGVFGFSVSHTTRAPRPGETDGVEYHFTTPETFSRLVADGAFIEHATFAGRSYGTTFAAVKHVVSGGQACVLDIEVEGVKQVKKSDLDARFCFVKPPSVEELERRLRGRGTEDEEAVRKRLERAKVELAFGEQDGVWDVRVVNDDVDRAYAEMEGWVMGVLGKKEVQN